MASYGVNPWYTPFDNPSPSIRMPRGGRRKGGGNLGGLLSNMAGIRQSIAKQELELMKEQVRAAREGRTRGRRREGVDPMDKRLKAEQAGILTAQRRRLEQEQRARDQIIGMAQGSVGKSGNDFGLYNLLTTLKGMTGYEGGASSFQDSPGIANEPSVAKAMMAARTAMPRGTGIRTARGAPVGESRGYTPSFDPSPYQTFNKGLLGSRESGGGIPEDGPYELHRGEHVISADQIDDPLMRYLMRDKARKMATGQMDGKGTGPGVKVKGSFQSGTLSPNLPSSMETHEEQQAALIRNLNRQRMELGLPPLQEDMEYQPGYLENELANMPTGPGISDRMMDAPLMPFPPGAPSANDLKDFGGELSNAYDFWTGGGQYADSTLPERVGAGLGAGARGAEESLGELQEGFRSGYGATRGDEGAPGVPTFGGPGGGGGAPTPPEGSIEAALARVGGGDLGSAQSPLTLRGAPPSPGEGPGVSYNEPQISRNYRGQQEREKADRLYKHIRDNIDTMSPDEYNLHLQRAKRYDQLADTLEKREDVREERSEALKESEREGRRSLEQISARAKAEGGLRLRLEEFKGLQRQLLEAQKKMVSGDAGERRRALEQATQIIYHLEQAKGRQITMQQAQAQAQGLSYVDADQVEMEMEAYFGGNVIGE